MKMYLPDYVCIESKRAIKAFRRLEHHVFLEMMFGQMPVLFVDGEQIAHSRAAFRYLARKFKLVSDDDVIAAKIDMWVEAVIESMVKLPFGEKDEKIKVRLFVGLICVSCIVSALWTNA